MPTISEEQFSRLLGKRTLGAAPLEKLYKAVLSDLEDAKSICGGDGQGCDAYRPYYTTAERRYRKCSHCPMDAMTNTREALQQLGGKEE